jgi:threonine dehydrogenase-like Zn-dependent dehydrogenase
MTIITTVPPRTDATPLMHWARGRTMKAAVFAAPGRIVITDRPVPAIGPLDALLRITTTSISDADLHIYHGEHAVAGGVVLGHEPVGVIEELGSAVEGFTVGQRVIAGAISPCGHCPDCLDGLSSRCDGTTMGAWRLGNTLDGCQAQYVRIPDAMVNLAPIPDGLTDEQVLMCTGIMNRGFAGAESAPVAIGDVVAVFAQDPVGLCATAAAHRAGAKQVFFVDRSPERLALAQRLGADVTIDFSKQIAVHAILEATGGRGVDVAIEALGTSGAFERSLLVLRPGGVMTRVGGYCGSTPLRLDALAAGNVSHRIFDAAYPGGGERMRRLMEVIAAGSVDLRPLVTHRFTLDRIQEAYDLLAEEQDGVVKVAITTS